MFIFIFLVTLFGGIFTDTFVLPVNSAQLNIAPMNCVRNSDYKIQIIAIDNNNKKLGWPLNWSDDDIEKIVSEANGILQNSSDNKFEYQQFNFAQKDCKISVIHYDIGEIKNYTTSVQLMYDMRHQFNLNNRKTKYIILDSYLDFNCGIGTLEYDDRPTPDNLSNGTGIVIMGCLSGWVLAHEIFHTLGAVQLSAPNSNGNGHCADAYDVMCYTQYGVEVRYVCTAPNVFDCNHDDYYSLSVNPETYLATHWNVANSLYLTKFYNIVLPLIFLNGVPAP